MEDIDMKAMQKSLLAGVLTVAVLLILIVFA